MAETEELLDRAKRALEGCTESIEACKARIEEVMPLVRGTASVPTDEDRKHLEPCYRAYEALESISQARDRLETARKGLEAAEKNLNDVGPLDPRGDQQQP